MNVLGVILARAGSVGLPNKHLLPLLGRPVIAYTIDHARAALRSGALSHVCVSSDCPAVLDHGRRAGFTVVERPGALATSEAIVQDVMLHAMDEVEMKTGFRAEALAVLYGNCPVRPPGVIERAVELIEQSAGDSVRSFCPVGKWHPAWMSSLRADDGAVTPLRPGSIHRRQDLEPLYLHDGAVVVVTRASMERGRHAPTDPHAFFGTDRRGLVVEPGETVEIDHARDLYLAEALLRRRAALSEESSTPYPIRKAS